MAGNRTVNLCNPTTLRSGLEVGMFSNDRTTGFEKTTKPIKLQRITLSFFYEKKCKFIQKTLKSKSHKIAIKLKIDHNKWGFQLNFKLAGILYSRWRI